MANTTSGSYVFDKNFQIDEIIEEAYERIGMQGVAGYQLRTARRSLNIMFQEWGNRGLHYWEVANNSITLVDGQSEYIMSRS
jgi:bifunctional pyridoxal-dependent enzyme with beta-cystathionase and maltose regulon repressor activities